MDADERDDDLVREAYEQRRARLSTRCQCGWDMPGTCPGPAACPCCVHDDDDEEA